MRDLQSYVDEEYRKVPEEAMRLSDGKRCVVSFQFFDSGIRMRCSSQILRIGVFREEKKRREFNTKGDPERKHLFPALEALKKSMLHQAFSGVL